MDCRCEECCSETGGGLFQKLTPALEVEAIKRIDRLAVNDGDVLVVTMREPASQELVKRLSEAIHIHLEARNLDNVLVLVVTT